MMLPCADLAGTEPVTPTTSSRGAKSRSAYLRAVRVWVPNETS